MVIAEEAADIMTFWVKDIVVEPDAEGVSSESKADIRQVVSCIASDRVLSVGVSHSRMTIASGY